MRERLSIRLIAATLAMAAPAAADQHAEDPFAGAERLEREALVSAVLARNADLEAARQAWLAARERPAQAGALADPMLSYALAPLSLGSGDASFGQELRVEQPLPYPGRRSLRRAEAEAEAEGAGEDLRAMRLELAAEATLRFEEYVLVHDALAINADHLRLLDDLREVAAARYAAGLVPQQDPLQAETEGAELLVRQAELEAEREVLTARLNALLHRTPGLPLPPPAPRVAAERELPDPGALEAAAVAARPEVRRREAEVRARRAALDLAKLARRPDVAVMGSYNSMWDMPEHRWMAGVNVELPLRRRRSAQQREAEALLAAAEAALLHAQDEARGEVREAHARLAEAVRVATIYESRLLPPARDQVDAARAALASGQASALAALEAERGLRRAELGYAEALAALARRHVELNRAAGRLPDGLDVETAEGEAR